MYTTNIIHHFVVLTILAVITATKAEVDCNEHPPFVHHKDCCQIQDLITEEVKSKCEEYMKPPGGPPESMKHDNKGMPPPGPPGIDRSGHHKHGPHHDCFFSCVFNETGILMDGELQEDNLNSYLSEALDDIEIIEILSNNFHNCSDKMTQRRDEGRGPPHHRCPPQSGMLMGCVMMKTFKECPESIWADTEECNASRDFWNKCNPHHSHNNNKDDDEEDDEEGDEEDVEEEEI